MAKTRPRPQSRRRRRDVRPKPPEASYGIVGLFDILGFKNFLQNNDPIYAATVASDCLKNALVNIRHVNPEFIPREEVQRLYEEISQEIQWLVFSDTILLTLPLTKRANRAKLFASWITYTFASMLLYRYMLDHGLPIRGAITVGDYLIRESCFSGHSIITSYHLGTELDLAAVTMDETAVHSLTEGFERSGFSPRHIVHRYNIPLRDGQYRNGFLLSPTPCAVPFVGDFTQAIYAAFFMHNKDIDAGVQRKILNTEAFFRFSKLVHGHAFVEIPAVISVANGPTHDPFVETTSTSNDKRKPDQK